MKSHIDLLIILLLFYADITAQWYQQNSGTTADLHSVFFLDENAGWVCGDSGKILKTTNGGLDWFEQNSNTTEGLKAVQFVDQENGWAYGANQILKTTDGGLSWSVQNFPSPSYIVALQFANLNIGWLIYQSSDTAHIVKTTDGGISWTLQSQSQNEYYTAMYFLDENYGWVTTFPNTIFPEGGVIKTTNGGNDWSQYEGNFWGGPMCVRFFNQMIGWVSHNNFNLTSYAISKSTDGGVTWDLQAAGSLRFVYSISFPDSSIGYAAGIRTFLPPVSGEGLILKTTDGGSNWFEQYRDDDELYSIFFVNDTMGRAAGNGGKILITENGGVTFFDYENSQTNPNDFILLQNYPNPFNPKTTIRFTILDVRFTILKVYDILGNEVATLVNEELPSGEYEVEFSALGGPASGIRYPASGIYFYQLKAGNFIETKKMVLIK